MSAWLRTLRRDQHGAAMVIGIFFAVFLIACVYRLHSLAEVLLTRQYQQDAADSAAFASAVVNARGMNLIVLINLVMAAVLSVLVGLRLAQALCLLGVGICAALAYPTTGQSLNYMPSFAQAAAKVGNWADEVEDIMPDILSALHTAGKVVSVVVPVGSNVRVIELTATQYGQTGVAIPGRLTLPVEDGEFIDLCRHAGELAGQVAMLPMEPFMPDFLVSGFSKATEALATSAPDWFCGDGSGEPPDIDPNPPKYDPKVLPTMPNEQRCKSATDEYVATYRQYAADQEATEAREQGLVADCLAASAELLASQPGRNGKAREGERLCSAECQTNPRESCPPGEQVCDLQLLEQIEAAGLATTVSSGADSPFSTRAALAREQCDPAAPHEHPLGGLWWRQRAVEYEYQWVLDATSGKGHYTLVGEPSLEAEVMVQLADEDRRVPCGQGGFLSLAHNAEGAVCESAPSCVGAAGKWFVATEPCPRQGPPAGPSTFRERAVRVEEILRCVELVPHEKVEPPRVDLAKDMQESNTEGQNTSPFQLEEGVWLGGSDFQLRSLVMRGEEVAPHGEAGVKLAAWGNADEPGGWTSLARFAGRLGLAQAEYYFDFGNTFKEYADQNDAEDRTEWMWNQGWVARLRSFRLDQSKADEPGKQPRGMDQEQLGFAPEGASDIPTDFANACKDPACGGMGDMLDALGAGEGAP